MIDTTGRGVTHARFGAGSVQSIDDDIISVDFGDYGQRRFRYPEAFASFLTADDADFVAQTAADLAEWREKLNARRAAAEKTTQAELAAARAPKKPAPKPRVPKKAKQPKTKA